MANQPQVNVLFVCLGNICRSPTAHGVFEHLVREAGLSHRIGVDSAGTGDWHIGCAPDKRSLQAALGKGIDISGLRARQVTVSDFARFDYVLAMDRANLMALEKMKPQGFGGHLGLFLPFASEVDRDEVPDPYYGGLDGFDDVYRLVHRASHGLLEYICQQLNGEA